ncbi:FG-GAP repeat domain-containing protein [Maribacter aestuarii]|uniref:FG-GAP repeat domain-containing protein n=1 Tax=Maribacter aestuarii TaxID=1130723 RepID=UPI0025A4CC5E|nr:VCBS repeat-containing protein [Maribacter aestuarii]
MKNLIYNGKVILKKILFAVLMLSLNAYAQDDTFGTWKYIEIDSTKQMWGDWDQPDWLRYFGLDSGDVNNDGNMDIISGRYIYHNPGGTMEGVWKRTVLDDNVDGILYMDVDKDPYADIIAMALPNLYWYEATNLEGTIYQRKKIGEVPATSHVNSQGFEKAQIIAGGLSEFVIAGNGDIYAVEIPVENPVETDWKIKMICQNTSDEGIGVGDIDGDGDLDIAAGRRPEGAEEPKILVWYENPGHINTLWNPNVVGESIHPIDRVEVLDLNNDGKTDIVVTEERYPGLEPDANFWWFSQNDLNSWERNKIVTQYSINNLDITDIDNDGDIDLLTAEHKGKALELQLWKNDGKGNFSKNILDTGKENHLGTQWVDLDADGDLDIIGAGWDQHKYMHVWRNDAVISLKSGMIFKEHPWTPDTVSDSGKFLRVGGKLDYKINEDHFPKSGHDQGFISFDQKIDLSNAVSAEVLVERVQSHEDTKNLKIQFNKGKPIYVPEPSLITPSATDYMFHSTIKVPVPLKDLINGYNAFKLTVDKEQSWDWPQNLIYGIVLRVYYKDMVVPELTLNGVSPEGKLGNEVQLSLSGADQGNVAQVDYIGLYEDVNTQGDGKYLQWQFRYHRGEITNHIGTSTTAPFMVTWDTSCIPDQSNPIRLAAVVTDNRGFKHVLSKVDNLSLDRDFKISLAKPFGTEPFWTTRNGEHNQYWVIEDEINNIQEARAYWNSWSPCYSEGFRINNIKYEPVSGTPCYDSHWHDERLEDFSSLNTGKVKLTTLKTPLHDGQMVHGMDVQWPGIMLKIKSDSKPEKAILITEGSYENRSHFIIRQGKITYYYDKAGGGFSRIIDRFGNDWVSYKSEPWDQYPASAASAYRGLPNLVFKSDTDGGAGHPGHDRCTSKIVDENKIRTTSLSGSWEWEWTFFNDYVQLDVLKSEKGTPYWFLYEGTPGGSYDPARTYFGTNKTKPSTEIPDFYKGTIDWDELEWAYFGKENVKTTFFVAHVDKDDHLDLMSYLGNSEDGALSGDGMTVFGFGRNEKTEPLLMGNNTFLIGMVDYNVNEQDKHTELSRHIQELIASK